MVERRERTGFRRSVAGRVLASYAIVTFAFALAAGFSLLAQQAAARETQLFGTRYLPLALKVKDLVATQDNWNTQLNDVTDAKNPADKRVWFDGAERVARPHGFDDVRRAVSLAFIDEGDDESRLVGETFITTTREIERFAKGLVDAGKSFRPSHSPWEFVSGLRRGCAARQLVHHDCHSLRQIHRAVLFARRNAQQPVAVTQFPVGQAGFLGAKKHCHAPGSQLLANLVCRNRQ